MNKYEAWCTVGFFGLILLLLATGKRDTGSLQLSGYDPSTANSDEFRVHADMGM